MVKQNYEGAILRKENTFHTKKENVTRLAQEAIGKWIQKRKKFKENEEENKWKMKNESVWIEMAEKIFMLQKRVLFPK